jgi:hypothetical protein
MATPVVMNLKNAHTFYVLSCGIMGKKTIEAGLYAH